MVSVPFVKNPNSTYCAQASMSGVLRFYDARVDQNIELLRVASADPAEVNTRTAGIAVALDEYGLSAEYCTVPYSARIDIEAEVKQLYAPAGKANPRHWYDDAVEKAIMTHVPESHDLIERAIRAGKPVIALIDLNVFHRRSHEYGRKLLPSAGHFVTVVGLDDTNVYIHQSGVFEPKESMPINRSLFYEASNAPGMAGDFVIAHGWRR